jgi:hypothetical protein
VGVWCDLRDDVQAGELCLCRNRSICMPISAQARSEITMTHTRLHARREPGSQRSPGGVSMTASFPPMRPKIRKTQKEKTNAVIRSTELSPTSFMDGRGLAVRVVR